MDENTMEYDEKFNCENNTYRLIVHDIIQNKRYEEGYHGEQIEEVISTQTDTRGLTYKITDVKIDKGNKNYESIPEDDPIVDTLFENYAQNYRGSEYNLYSDSGLNYRTEKFEIYPDYKGIEYIILFELV